MEGRKEIISGEVKKNNIVGKRGLEIRGVYKRASKIVENIKDDKGGTEKMNKKQEPTVCKNKVA